MIERTSDNPILRDARIYRRDRLSMNNPKGWLHVRRKVVHALDVGLYMETTGQDKKDAATVLSRLARLEEGAERLMLLSDIDRAVNRGDMVAFWKLHARIKDALEMES